MPVGSAIGLTFEIGDATTYAPIDATFGTVSVTGTLTASTTPGEHPSIGTSNIDSTHDVNRWWSLINSGIGFDTLDATFTFSPSDLDPGAQPSQFIVGKWDGAWALPTVSARSPTSITASGISSLSEFAVGEAASDLSVALSASALSIPLGGSVHITATITNTGPSDATGVSLVLAPPAGSTYGSIVASQGSCALVLATIVCDLGSLASGASATVEFDDTPASQGTATFAAAVSGDQSDSVSGNDSDSLDVEVEAAAESASASGSLPDVAMMLWPHARIGPLPALVLVWLLLLAVLAGVNVRRSRARR